MSLPQPLNPAVQQDPSFRPALWVNFRPALTEIVGLGHETPSAETVLDGGRPTQGFLEI